MIDDMFVLCVILEPKFMSLPASMWRYTVDNLVQSPNIMVGET